MVIEDCTYGAEAGEDTAGRHAQPGGQTAFTLAFYTRLVYNGLRRDGDTMKDIYGKEIAAGARVVVRKGRRRGNLRLGTVTWTREVQSTALPGHYARADSSRVSVKLDGLPGRSHEVWEGTPEGVLVVASAPYPGVKL